MTNKPMLSVERDIIELAHTVFVRAGYESVARDLKILLCKKEDKQPAPVAVVMPERMKDLQQDYSYVRFMEGCNAALDTVDGLNGVKP